MSPPLRLIAPTSSSRALRVLRTLQPASSRLSPFAQQHNATQRPFHTSPSLTHAHNKFNETVPDQPPPTDFARMDVLGQTPAPATSIDACLPDGFVLGNGSVTISDGSGALLVAGEAFAWRPWDGVSKKLVNSKGQWDLSPEVLEQAFGLLGLVWPRPGMFSLWRL